MASFDVVPASNLRRTLRHSLPKCLLMAMILHEDWINLPLLGGGPDWRPGLSPAVAPAGLAGLPVRGRLEGGGRAGSGETQT
jgi:hypothetical protein